MRSQKTGGFLPTFIHMYINTHACKNTNKHTHRYAIQHTCMPPPPPHSHAHSHTHILTHSHTYIRTHVCTTCSLVTLSPSVAE